MKKIWHFPFAKYSYVWFNGVEKINENRTTNWRYNTIPTRGIWRVKISIKTGDVWDQDDMKLIFKI